MRQRSRGIRLSLEQRDFRYLWLSQVAGDLGDALGRIALAVLVFDETGSSFLAASVLAVVVVPFFGPGQALTAWCERFPRRRVLIVTDLVRAACFATIALPLPLGQRFALLLAASLATPPFLAIRRALVASIVPPDRYSDAVTLTTATTEVCILTGTGLAGVLAASIGPAGVLAIDAATFLVSALLLGALTAGRSPVAGGSSVFAQLADGIDAIRGDQRVLRLAWLFPLASAGALGTEAVLTPLTLDTLGRSEAVIGLLGALVSVGVLATSVALRRHSRHDALLRQTARLAGIGGAIAGLAFAAPVGLASVALAYLATGLVFACRVPTIVVIGQRLADSVRASAMSVLDGAYALAQLVAALGAGAVAEAVDNRAASVASCVVTVAAATAALRRPLPAAETTRRTAIS